MGARLRAEREGRGWNKPEMARRLGETLSDKQRPDLSTLLSYVKRWERGKVGITQRHKAAYATAFGMEQHELFAERILAGQVIKIGSQGTDLPVMDGLRSHCRADLVSSGRGPQGVDTSQVFLDAIERLVFAPATEDLPTSGRHRVGMAQVAQIEAATKIFRAWDNRFGGGLRRKAVVGQLTELTSLLAGPFVDEQAARRLYVAVADLAQLAGFMSFDLRLHATAREYFVFGLRLAAETGDRLQVARMLYCLARQMIELDRPREALDLAQTGVYAIRRVTAPKVAAMLHGMEGRAYGCLGDAAGCHRALGTAADRFASVGTGEDPEWAGFFSQAELAGITGVALRDLTMRHVVIGDEEHVRTYAAEARPWITQAAEGRPAEYLRSQVLDLDGLAIIELLSGEPESATAALTRALDLVPEVNSARVDRNLRRTLQLGQARYPDVPAVHELADRARTILPGTSERV